MLKKIIVIAILVVLVGFSVNLARKTPTPVAPTKNKHQKVKTENYKDQTFAFKLNELNIKCSIDDEQLCAVESAVKCTLDNTLENCADLNLPKFIFMSNPELDRPTEISYKITAKKTLINNAVEVYTDSSCNGGWFGLCQGTVIYVLDQKPANKWYVRDIYAIE